MKMRWLCHTWQVNEMKQWKTIISVILIFGLGALAGTIVTYKIYWQKMENIIRDEPKAMREFQRIDVNAIAARSDRTETDTAPNASFSLAVM